MLDAPAAWRPTPVLAGRLRIGLGILALVAVSLGVAWAAAGATGATTAGLLEDPGPFVRYGLVVAQGIVDLAAALTIGLLVLTAVAVPASGPGRAHRPALVAASAAATVWAFAGVALGILTYANVSGQAMSDPAFGAGVVAFAEQVDLGRELLVTALIAAVIGLIAAAASSIGTTGLLAALALVALIPPALAGHAAGTANHETAVTALGLHLLGICVWVGGLAGLLVLRWLPGPGRLTGSGLASTTRRYSTLAFWSFWTVAASGVITAVLRVGSWSGLATWYGTVVILKTVLLLALGAAGWWHRRGTMVGIDAGRPGAFVRLAAAELVVMAVAIGLGVALSRSTPPSTATAPILDAVTSLTGYPMPPAPTLSRWFTQWQPDLLWIVVAGLMLGGYLTGVIRLRRRGDAWPVLRTVCWCVGVALLLYVTCGGPMVYGRVQFSAHMVEHMMLTMVVPPFLVLAAPVTVMLRTTRVRTDGSRGLREWLLVLLGSRLLKVLAFPPVAAAIFAGSLIAFYYTPLFGQALTTHLGHELMHVHFLLAGYLFAYVLVGVDPGPRRAPYPLRLVVLFATMGFHAFFGVAVISGRTVLQEPFFAALHRPWSSNLLDDQRFGGSLAWGIGELPTVLLALLVAVQWSRSDEREARRYDRAADRDGDAELDAYNAMLTRLGSRRGSLPR